MINSWVHCLATFFKSLFLHEPSVPHNFLGQIQGRISEKFNKYKYNIIIMGWANTNYWPFKLFPLGQSVINLCVYTIYLPAARSFFVLCCIL